jgi:thiamine monophosphate synthase
MTTKPSSIGAIPVGAAEFMRIRNKVKIPCVGIGGITVERLPEVLSLGADYIAMVSTILNACNVFEAVKEIDDIVRRYDLENSINPRIIRKKLQYVN